jgi:hypothetical protein
MCVKEHGESRGAATAALAGWGITVVISVYYLLTVLGHPIEGWDLLMAPLALVLIFIAAYMLVSIVSGRETVQRR